VVAHGKVNAHAQHSQKIQAKNSDINPMHAKVVFGFSLLGNKKSRAMQINLGSDNALLYD
jgi:hypothetical protein